MKKKELLQMRALPATPAMMELVHQDKETIKTATFTYKASRDYRVYERYQYYRAAVQNGILKVAVFSRKLLAAGDTRPQYEIYLSKEENTHLTYAVASGKWRTGKINSLDYDLDNGCLYGNKPWASDHTKKMVNDYLGTGDLEVKEAILDFQDQVGADRLRKKHKSELEEIDAVMNAVPELPKDFDRWVLDSAFIHERCLFYRYGDKENTAYCTHCRKMVKLKGTPKHNTNGVCPSCRSNALLKSWKKQKYLTSEKQVGIIQELTDGSGYILRRFRCRTKRTQESGWKLEEAGCWETERYQLGSHFEKRGFFEWGQYKNTGIFRWRHELNHGFGHTNKEKECILYPRNLKKMRKGTEMQYIPIEELWKHNQGSYCCVGDDIRWLIRHPKTEYLIKAGLYRLAWDLMREGGYSGDIIDWGQTKPWKALGIPKEQLAMCIKMDITRRQLDVLQRADAMGIRLTEEQICFFTREIGPGLVEEIFQYGHHEKFKRYLEGLITKKENRIGDYMDYLDDIRFFRLKPDKDILFPKDFQQIHQRLALQRQEKEDKLKRMEISEKDALLQSMLPELKEIYTMEDENFTIVLPACKEDFNREGRENHNCVGGTYFDKMLEGKSCVMFLRRKEEPDKAFCTVEMQGSRILQNKAVRNSVPPQEAIDFMEKFSKEVGKRIRKRKKQIMLQTAV